MSLSRIILALLPVTLLDDVIPYVRSYVVPTEQTNSAIRGRSHAPLWGREQASIRADTDRPTCQTAVVLFYGGLRRLYERLATFLSPYMMITASEARPAGARFRLGG